MKLRRLLEFPWERLLGLCVGAYALYTLQWRAAHCYSYAEADRANVEFLAQACRADRRFQTAYDCAAYERKLEGAAGDEVWWECFWHSFYFYRSWLRIVFLSAFVLVVVLLRRASRPERTVYMALPPPASPARHRPRHYQPALEYASGWDSD
jgi:hypothetical protein